MPQPDISELLTTPASQALWTANSPERVRVYRATIAPLDQPVAELSQWFGTRSVRPGLPKLTVMTITMYGADWCGDCRRAEKFFVDNKIDFRKVDLELDVNKHFVESEVLRRNNGKKSIPVIVFDDDSHLTEPTNAQLAEKLGL